MRKLCYASLCVLLAACMQSKAQVAAPQQPAPVQVVNSDCYTVDLFTKVKVEKPAKDVPAEQSAFLGAWGGGAWNDVWCHDLLVTKVERGGRVELVEMHAPYDPWNQPATAFRRVAHIDDKGNLRYASGTETFSYRIEDGKLIGKRSGRVGNLHVELRRRGEPPVPARKPIRLAQAEAPQKPGG